MYKTKNSVVTLKMEARESADKMLSSLKIIEPNLKIDRSRLVSYIVIDYFEKNFEKNKKKIITAHKDSRKQIKEKLPELSNEQLESLSKYLVKIQSGSLKDE